MAHSQRLLLKVSLVIHCHHMVKLLLFCCNAVVSPRVTGLGPALNSPRWLLRFYVFILFSYVLLWCQLTASCHFPAFLAVLLFVLQFSEFLQNHVSKPVKISSKGSHSRLSMKARGTFLWIKNVRFPRVGVWACPDTSFHVLWVSHLAFASSRLLHKWPGDKSRYNRAAGEPLILWASLWGQT